MERARAVCVFVAQSNVDSLQREINAGRTFPACGFSNPRSGDPLMILPPKGRIGHTLNLKVLRDEFMATLERMFPPKLTMSVN